jgi:hypothetical protein
MATREFMGRNQLIDRLTAQVGDRDKALAILTDRGHYDPKTKKLTPAGEARNKMTAEERAIDRAASKSKYPASAFRYNARTNRATLKR